MNPQDEHQNSNGGVTKEEILPNYDFQPKRTVGSSSLINAGIDGSQNPRGLIDSKIVFSNLRLSGLLEPQELTNISHGKEKDSFIAAASLEIDSIVKKHGDILLHGLEAISSRLSQVESKTRYLANSVDELKVSIENSNGSTDGKLGQLENVLKEVQTSMQFLRDRQEITEAQLQLEKLQAFEGPVGDSNTLQSDSRQQALPQPHTPPLPPREPYLHPPALQADPAHQQYQMPPQPAHPAHQQYQMPPQQADPAHQQYQMPPPPTDPAHLQYQMPPQQADPAHQQYQMPPQQADPAHQHYQMPPLQTAPAHQQYQMPAQQMGPAHQQYQTPPQPPPAQQYQPSPQMPPHHLNPSPKFQPLLPHHPEESTMAYILPQTYNRNNRSPSTQPPGGPPPQQYYGPNPGAYGPPLGSDFSEPYPHSGPPSHYSGSMKPPPVPSTAQQRLPRARILPQALPAESSSSGGGGETKLPIDDVVEKVVAMGFYREQVRATVQELTENGQSVDPNIVLDKLMNDGDTIQPQKGWFGR